MSPGMKFLLRIM